MDVRAISTVVDATLFVLVLGVAVATVVAVPVLTASDGTDGTAGPGGQSTDRTAADGIDNADAIVEHLATGTERVEYSLAPAARALDGDPPRSIHDGPPFSRSAHGTLASLLGDAAVATMTVEGESIAPDGQSFEAAVADATERRIQHRNVSVGVTATWEPYPDAPLSGRVSAGRHPPPAVDVNAATVTVDAPMPASRSRAIEAARTDGFDGVGTVVADAIVRGMFPPNRTTLALRGDYPVDALVANRYGRARVVFGASRGVPTAHADVAATNDELAAALADSLAADLADRYDSPTAAARNVSTGTATVAVRTWSR